VLFAAGALGFAPAPLPKTVSARTDLKRMQGTWELIWEMRGGTVQPHRPLEMTIRGKRMAFSANGSPADQWDISLDVKKKPQELDMKQPGPGKLLLRAVYGFERDNLRLCINVTGGRRPTSLTKGDAQLVFKRVKKSGVR
jgi:uncharacterized protein (TIGR03067 family)